jgi:tetratricopeptide (TPR) repeat protein
MVRKWIGNLRGGAVVVGLVSLSAQAFYLCEIADTDSFNVPIIDSDQYHQAAVGFSEGKPLDDDAFWQPPLFPFLLGCLYRACGVNIALAKIGLAILGAGSCLLLWRLGATLFAPRVGLLAGLMLAVYGPFIFFATELLPAGLGIFLTLLSLVLWTGSLHRPAWYRWAILGMAVGAGTLTIPNAAVVGVLAAGGLLIVAIRDRCPASAGHAAWVLLGFSLLVAPVTIRNYRVSGRAVLISTNGGINFFIGNNPQRDRTVAIRPGEYWQRLGRESYGQAPVSRATQDDYFWKRGIRYAFSDPIGFAKGMAEKAILFLNAREVPRNIDVYVRRDDSTLLQLLCWKAPWFAFPAGFVIPLAIVGLLVCRGSTSAKPWQLRGKLALAAFAVAYALSVVLFFVTSRYRLPLMPTILLFAAAFIAQTWDALRSRSGERALGRIARTSAALAVATIAVNWPVRTPTDHINFAAEREMCFGQAFSAAGALDKAEDRLRTALALDAEYGAATANLANVMAKQGNLAEAEHLALRARMLDRNSLEACWTLADVLHRQQRLPEATALFREALAVDRYCNEAHMGLAEIALQTGDRDQAIEHYKFVAAAGHNSSRVRRRLSELLVERGDYEEGITWYKAALDRDELDPASLNALAWLLATCPRTELRDCNLAVSIAERVCSLTDYNHAVALDTLAAAYAECGRFDQAIFFSQRAVERATRNREIEAMTAFEGRLNIYRSRSQRAAVKGDKRSSSIDDNK